MIPDWILAMLATVALIPTGFAINYWFNKDWVGFSFSVWLIVVFLGLVVCLYIRNDDLAARLKAETPIYHGKLVPGHDPAPDEFAREGFLYILLGDSLGVRALAVETTVVSSGGKPVITVGVGENGALWISAVVTDEQGRPLVRVVKNEFQAFPERTFNPKQPDPHTLIIRSETGERVLYLRHMMPFAFKITGKFVTKKGKTFEIVDTIGILVSGGPQVSHLTVDLTERPGVGAFEIPE